MNDFDAAQPAPGRRWYARVLDGRLTTLLGLILAGLLVVGVLFSTVHKARDLTGTGMIQIMMVWIEHGYFKHGGLRFTEPVDANPTQRVWRSNPMGYMQSAHLTQRIHVALTGRPSFKLLALHNQAVVMLASALLGLLAFRVVVQIGVTPPHAILMALAASSVYQTFPSNMNAILSMYPTLFVALALIVFLIIELRAIGDEAPPAWCAPVRAAAVFAMFYADAFSGILFAAFYGLVSLVMAPVVHRRYRFLPTIVAPAVVAIALFGLQVLWVKWRHPGVELYGSDFMFRSGFDGDATYYKTHLGLFLRRLLFAPKLRYLAQWWVLLIGGAVALVWIVAAYLRSRPDLRAAVYILTLALMMYVPYSFLLSQATLIHPWAYDQYLTVPLILGLFAILPAMLGRTERAQGVFALASVIGAFCYCMVQLRMYALVYPAAP